MWRRVAGATERVRDERAGSRGAGHGALRRLVTLCTTVALAVHLCGLQVLCLCGACPLSQVVASLLPGSEPTPGPPQEHACCAAARKAAERTASVQAAADPCACEGTSHALATWVFVEQKGSAAVPSGDGAIRAVPPSLAPQFAGGPSLRHAGQQDVHGPPEPAPLPLYLASHRLLI